MNFFLGRSNKKEEPKPAPETTPSLSQIESEKEENKIDFGDMRLSKKFIFYEKRFVNCILPPNPILPGRKTYPFLNFRRDYSSKKEGA